LLQHTFTLFLRGVLPAITSPNSPPRAKNRAAAAVFQYPDYYSPFRAVAPTLARALPIIYPDINSVASPQGLFNILCFRGVFFGSTYALHHLQWFSSYSAWALLWNERQDEKFYVNKRAYGSAQLLRSVDLIDHYRDVLDEEHWTNLQDGWSALIRSQPDPLQLFHFFLNFRNIGPLSAMLIVGDLAQAGIIHQPSFPQMATMILRVNCGAMDAMRDIGVISDSSSEVDVTEALITLHSMVVQDFSDEERACMRYDHIMLEHALCKYIRMKRSSFV
jgi:hypothetical protein